MATVTGLVQRLTWVANLLCAWVGPSPTNATVLVSSFEPGDTELELEFKSSIITLLTQAFFGRYQVEVGHGDGDSIIFSATNLGADISPSGLAISNDFFSVAGVHFPADARIIFDTSVVTVVITPDVARPSWLLVAGLPTVIPIGETTLHVEGTGYRSQDVRVRVQGGPRVHHRTLYSGAPKPAPYTFAMVANPAIRTEAGAIVADPVLGDRAGYHAAVSYTLDNILQSSEDLLATGALESRFRFSTRFDESLPAINANALVQEDAPNLMETRRSLLNAFMGGEYVTDLVFLLHGSTTHTRSTAWFTTDDPALPGVSYTHDGVARRHGRFAQVPGSVALTIGAGGLTALHEFGHAASDFANGMVDDLYVDSVRPGYEVNKKGRALATNPIPSVFGVYEGTSFASDPTRDGIGYPATWISYHPQLTDPARPNAMDNYWLADDVRRCRFDRLTRAWFLDRLAAKVSR
jgi:hypothetical protein